MEHTLLLRTGAFAFASALTLSVAACDDSVTQPSDEDPMVENGEEEEEDTGGY